MATIKVGDAVKLKEGSSPIMVVDKLVEVYNRDYRTEAVCKWYDSEAKEFRTHTFVYQALKKYSRRKRKPRN